MNVRTLAACALGATTLLSAPSALAVEPAQLHEGASVAGLIGFGFPYGFNFGARGGYTLSNHVYLGGTFIYNFDGGSGFTTGFEGGYEFAAGPVVVRPYGGLGVADESYGYGNYYNATAATLCAQGQTIYCSGPGGSSVSFAFWVGGTAMYDFKGGPWFVAADFRMGDAPGLAYINNFYVQFLPGGGYEF